MYIQDYCDDGEKRKFIYKIQKIYFGMVAEGGVILTLHECQATEVCAQTRIISNVLFLLYMMSGDHSLIELS